MKILVVDGRAANRGLMSFLLEDASHQVVEAASEMKARTDHYAPIVFLTGLSDDASLSKCIESGGDDFLTKPVNEVLLRAKIKAHERIRELNSELNKKNKGLERYQKLLDQEHEHAAHVFESAIS